MARNDPWSRPEGWYREERPVPFPRNGRKYFRGRGPPGGIQNLVNLRDLFEWLACHVLPPNKQKFGSVVSAAMGCISKKRRRPININKSVSNAQTEKIKQRLFEEGKTEEELISEEPNDYQAMRNIRDNQFNWAVPLPFPEESLQAIKPRKGKERSFKKLLMISEWFFSKVPREIRHEFEHVLKNALFDWYYGLLIDIENVNFDFLAKMIEKIDEGTWRVPNHLRRWYRQERERLLFY